MPRRTFYSQIEDYNDPFANVTNTKKELIEPYHIKISDGNLIN